MKITDAKPLPRYQLELQFDNGKSGIVDLSSLAGRGVFVAWNEPGVFERVAVMPTGSVEWPGEVDLCPDALYMRMIESKTELDALNWDRQFEQDVAEGRLDKLADQALDDFHMGSCTDI
jgi:hypothetical protein